VVGEGWMLEKVPLVAIVVGRTCCMVVVIGIVIHILMILDPGLLAEAMSNRAPNLHLSRLLLPY